MRSFFWSFFDILRLCIESKFFYLIENCPLSETILSLEEPSFQDFIFIGISFFVIVAAEIDKEITSNFKID